MFSHPYFVCILPFFRMVLQEMLVREPPGEELSSDENEECDITEEYTKNTSHVDEVGNVISLLSRSLTLNFNKEWNWKYKMKSRIKTTKVWGRYSMIFPLGVDGCTLGVINGPHIHSRKVHLSTAKRIHIPYGCLILFHAGLFHYGDRSLMECGGTYPAIRGLSYIVEKDILNQILTRHGL